jgi:hypothetical protein
MEEPAQARMCLTGSFCPQSADTTLKGVCHREAIFRHANFAKQIQSNR